MKKTKKELIKKYKERKPKEFIQFDSFVCNGQPELYEGKTIELMRGSDVRVLIDPATPKDDILRSLLQITEWIVRDYDKLVSTEAGLDNKPTDDIPFLGKGAMHYTTRSAVIRRLVEDKHRELIEKSEVR